jgi:SAM-dependent methyltransferase
MPDLSSIATNIELGPEGLWISPAVSAISYPESANELYFGVEDTSFWFAHRNQCILAAIRNLPPPGAFFDIGGGNGYVAKALQDAGLDVVLVEPGIHGSRNARRRGVLQVVCSTLHDASFCSGVLPSVGLFDVVEHIEDDRAFLSDVHSHLIPGGRIYLTVPAFPQLWSGEDAEAGHWHRYTLSQICSLLTSTGFEVEYATYFFQFLLLPIFFLRALPCRLGISSKNGGQQAVQRDHQVANSTLKHGIGWLSRHELRRICSGRRIGPGASCMVVARKPIR